MDKKPDIFDQWQKGILTLVEKYNKPKISLYGNENELKKFKRRVKNDSKMRNMPTT